MKQAQTCLTQGLSHIFKAEILTHTDFLFGYLEKSTEWIEQLTG